MPPSDHPATNLIILVLVVAIAGLGLCALLWKPADPVTLNTIVTTLSAALTGALGAKFGLTRAVKSLPPGVSESTESSETKTVVADVGTGHTYPTPGVNS